MVTALILLTERGLGSQRSIRKTDTTELCLVTCYAFWIFDDGVINHWL